MIRLLSNVSKKQIKFMNEVDFEKMINEENLDLCKYSDLIEVEENELIQDDYLDDKYIKVDEMKAGIEYVVIESGCYYESISENIVSFVRKLQ